MTKLLFGNMQIVGSALLPIIADRPFNLRSVLKNLPKQRGAAYRYYCGLRTLNSKRQSAGRVTAGGLSQSG